MVLFNGTCMITNCVRNINKAAIHWHVCPFLSKNASHWFPFTFIKWKLSLNIGRGESKSWERIINFGSTTHSIMHSAATLVCNAITLYRGNLLLQHIESVGTSNIKSTECTQTPVNSKLENRPLLVLLP